MNKKLVNHKETTTVHFLQRKNIYFLDSRISQKLGGASGSYSAPPFTPYGRNSPTRLQSLDSCSIVDRNAVGSSLLADSSLPSTHGDQMATTTTMTTTMTTITTTTTTTK